MISLPERGLRSTGALAGGLLKELTQIVLPSSFRRTKLYRSLVETTLRFIVEQVGKVERKDADTARLPSDFTLRRSAGNGIEMLGVLLFRMSPVWVLAALSDLSGASRVLVREITQSLQENGLLEKGASFETIDQMLDGLERTSGRLADNLNMPPLDVQTLRQEWKTLQQEAGRIPPRQLPTTEQLAASWRHLQNEAATQECSVFELSSLMALTAAGQLPSKAVWLSRCATLAARKTGELLAATLLENYSSTLKRIHRTGYLRYWAEEFSPYLKAAARHFSASQSSFTERFLAWCFDKKASQKRIKQPPHA